MDARRLDGNAVAGVLADVFAAEMTSAVGTCAKCSAAEPVGAMHVYRGAGIVLRCPHCESVLMRAVVGETRPWLDLRGLRSLEVGG
jgi:hypothetical protein